MVFSVSEKVKADCKTGSISDDSEAQWDTIPATSLVYRRQTRSTRFCIVFPWLLFLLCFVMLGCVSTWGWREHFKAQDLMLKLEGAEKTTTTLLPTVPEAPFPYGNDALPPPPPEPEQPVGFMVNWVIQLDQIYPEDGANDPGDGIFYPPQPQDVEPQDADREPTDNIIFTPQPQDADMDIAPGEFLNTGPVKFNGPLLFPDGSPIIFPCAEDEPVILPEGTKLPKLNETGIIQILPSANVTESETTDG